MLVETGDVVALPSSTGEKNQHILSSFQHLNTGAQETSNSPHTCVKIFTPSHAINIPREVGGEMDI
jgi:hypothetical protein